jgi:hypothetical protein
MPFSDLRAEGIAGVVSVLVEGLLLLVLEEVLPEGLLLLCVEELSPAGLLFVLLFAVEELLLSGLLVDGLLVEVLAEDELAEELLLLFVLCVAELSVESVSDSVEEALPSKMLSPDVFCSLEVGVLLRLLWLFSSFLQAVKSDAIITTTKRIDSAFFIKLLL